MSVIQIIFSNIWGYDGLIFLLMAVNIAIYILARTSIFGFYDAMHRRIYAPEAEESVAELTSELEVLTAKRVDEMRTGAVKWYTLYGTITGIFPMLGILGTVVSLLGMVGETADITGGFFAALTSTFWGLVFAIIFKFMDSFISPKLEESDRAAEAFLQKKADKE